MPSFKHHLSGLAAACLVLALTSPALAAQPEQDPGYTSQIRLNPNVPSKVPGEVQTNLPDAEKAAAILAARAAALAPAEPAVLPPPIPAGLPAVPASLDPAPASAQASPAASPDGAPTPPPGFVAGEPLPTYATMAEAASAGVAPFKDDKPLVLAAPPLAAPDDESFNWGNPDAYLDWIAANPLHGGLAAGGGVLFLLVLMGAWMRRQALR